MPTLEHPDTFASNRKLLPIDTCIRCDYCNGKMSKETPSRHVPTKPAAFAAVEYDFGDDDSRFVCRTCYDRIRFDYEPTYAELVKQ